MPRRCNQYHLRYVSPNDDLKAVRFLVNVSLCFERYCDNDTYFKIDAIENIT